MSSIEEEFLLPWLIRSSKMAQQIVWSMTGPLPIVIPSFIKLIMISKELLFDFFELKGI